MSFLNIHNQVSDNGSSDYMNFLNNKVFNSSDIKIHAGAAGGGFSVWAESNSMNDEDLAENVAWRLDSELRSAFRSVHNVWVENSLYKNRLNEEMERDGILSVYNFMVNGEARGVMMMKANVIEVMTLDENSNVNARQDFPEAHLALSRDIAENWVENKLREKRVYNEN